MRSWGGRCNRRLEVAKSALIGVYSSLVGSIGHELFMKTYSYDARAILLQLQTILRGKSSAQTGHLTASRLSSSSLSHLGGHSISLAFALALGGLGICLERHGL
jgi:hypothetical protein